MKSLSILILCLLTTACASGYKQYGWNGGYKEQQLSENMYEVTYLGSATAPQDTVNEYWHRRAKELCNDDYQYRITNVRGSAQFGDLLSTQQAKVEGIVTCQPN